MKLGYKSTGTGKKIRMKLSDGMMPEGSLAMKKEMPIKKIKDSRGLNIKK